jgi:predicted nucleotidyltransferase
MELLRREVIASMTAGIEKLGYTQFLFLEFGSVAFDADTKESDYDVVVAVTPSNSNEDFNSMRRVSFFRDLPKILSSPTMLVFSVWQAQTPILKIQYKANLWIDVSFAFVEQKVAL